jgi:hypothetical protein
MIIIKVLGAICKYNSILLEKKKKKKEGKYGPKKKIP